MKAVRKLSLALAAMISSVTFVPILASILSFITYYLTGHDLNVAIIFSSLQFFNIIRAPLIMFPIVVSAVADAMVALGRIGKFLNAEEMHEPYQIDLNSPNAVNVDADFTWEVTAKAATAKANDDKSKDKQAKTNKKDKSKKDKGTILPTSAQGTDISADDQDRKEDDKPFALQGLEMTVPKGAFVAVVGRIGSGKSSLLQGIFGEMRRTRGQVVIGGSLAYVPQTPWIMNATIRSV
jgi:ATP-binding cassette, subfamily C (CFTR/MRP), member 1